MGKTLGPRPFLLIVNDARVIVVWIKVRSHSLMKPSKAYSVEEMELSDRFQNNLSIFVIRKPISAKHFPEAKITTTRIWNLEANVPTTISMKPLV